MEIQKSFDQIGFLLIADIEIILTHLFQSQPFLLEEENRLLEECGIRNGHHILIEGEQILA